MAYTEEQLDLAAAALDKCYLEFSSSSRGRQQYSCECGGFFMDSRDDEDGFTDRELKEVVAMGDRHMAEMALKAALGE